MKTNLGKALRIQRYNNDYSLRDFSTLLGVSYGFLSEIERGDKLPSVQNLQKISEIYRIPIEELKQIYLLDKVDKLSQDLSNDLEMNIKLSIVEAKEI